MFFLRRLREAETARNSVEDDEVDDGTELWVECACATSALGEGVEVVLLSFLPVMGQKL